MLYGFEVLMFEIGRQIGKEILRECVLIILTLD